MNPFNSQQLFWVVVPDLGSVAEQVAVHFQSQGFQVQIHPLSAQSVYVYLFRVNHAQPYNPQPRPDLMIYIETRQNHTAVQAGAAGSVGTKVWKALSNPGLDRTAMEVTGRCLYRVAGQPYPEAPPMGAPIPGHLPPPPVAPPMPYAAPVPAPLPSPVSGPPTTYVPLPPSVSAPPSQYGPHEEPKTPVTGVPVSGAPVSGPPVSGPPSPPPGATRLQRFCTRCGSEIIGEAKFCGQCGTAAPPHK